MFASVLSQESDVQQLSFVYVVHTCFSFLVFIQIRRFVSRLNGFTLVIFGALYSLLFGVGLCSLLQVVLWFIMVYTLQIVTWVKNCLIGTRTLTKNMVSFYKLLLGLRVVSLALISHLPIVVRPPITPYNLERM